MTARAGAWALFMLAAAAAAWAVTPADETAKTGAACERDAQCASGFCDLQRCAEPEGVYGRACDPAPRTEDGPRDGKLHACGAYLCTAGRCRSCASDEQCREELGAPRCLRLDGSAGARCGR